VKRQRIKASRSAFEPAPAAYGAAAPGARQKQWLQAEEEHVPHERGTVRAWALSPVPGGHRQGRNSTRDLRLREAWAIHSALALHCARVY